MKVDLVSMERSEPPESNDVLHLARKVGSWCKKKGGYGIDKGGERGSTSPP